MNLWQKNNVFSPDVIQPLLDLAHPNPSTAILPNTVEGSLIPFGSNSGATTSSSSSSHNKHHRTKPLIHTNSNVESPKSGIDLIFGANLEKNSELATQLKQLSACLTQLNDDQTFKNDIDHHIDDNKNVFRVEDDEDDDVSTPTEAEPSYPKPSKLSKKLLDDSKQLKALAKWMQILQDNDATKTNIESNLEITSPNLNNESNSPENHLQSNNSSQELILQKFFSSSAVTLASAAAAENTAASHTEDSSQLTNQSTLFNDFYYQENNRDSCSPAIAANSEHQSDLHSDDRRSNHRHHRDRDRRYLDRYGSSSSKHRLSPSRDGYDHRHRSRSRNRDRSRSRSASILRDADFEREEREKEKRRKGYPSIRKDCMTICSTTLWIGHLPKRTTSQSDLNDLFGEYGVINSIDVCYFKINFNLFLILFLITNS